MHRLTIITVLLGGLMLAGCRGDISQAPPVHLNQNMDFQERFEAQEANPFFADGRAMRPPVAGTVARGMLKEDTRFYEGRDTTGAFITGIPIQVTRELWQRGQERFNIYCAVCHGRAGDGQGIVTTGGYGYTPAPDFHLASVAQRIASDGYIFDVISNGYSTMPAYGPQIPVADRWAIVAYIRALQRSQNASIDDLPESELANIQQGS